MQANTISKIKSTFRKNKKCHFTHFCKKQKVNEGILSPIHLCNELLKTIQYRLNLFYFYHIQRYSPMRMFHISRHSKR